MQLPVACASPYSSPHSRFIRDAHEVSPRRISSMSPPPHSTRKSLHSELLPQARAGGLRPERACAPCKALMPLLAQIAESYQGELLLAKVDCEAEQDIVARFGIRSLLIGGAVSEGWPAGRWVCRGAAGVGSAGNAGAACADATTARGSHLFSRPRRCSPKAASTMPRPCW